MQNEASITVEVAGMPVTVQRKGTEFFVQGIAASVLDVEDTQNAILLLYEEDGDPYGQKVRISGEQFYQLLYGDQAPDLGRFGLLEAQAEMLGVIQTPPTLPALTHIALARMLHALPVPIDISLDMQNNLYVWEVLQGSGSASKFLDAMREALTYLESARMKEQ